MPPRRRQPTEPGMFIGGAWFSEAYLAQVAEQFNDPEVRERVAQMEAYLRRAESKAKSAAKKKATQGEKKAKAPRKKAAPKSRFDLLKDED